MKNLLLVLFLGFAVACGGGKKKADSTSVDSTQIKDSLAKANAPSDASGDASQDDTTNAPKSIRGRYQNEKDKDMYAIFQKDSVIRVSYASGEVKKELKVDKYEKDKRKLTVTSPSDEKAKVAIVVAEDFKSLTVMAGKEKKVYNRLARHHKHGHGGPRGEHGPGGPKR